MIGVRDSRAKILAIAAVLAVVVIVIAVKSSGKESVGSLSVTASLAGAEAVGDIGYTISGNNLAPITGTSPLTNPSAPTTFTVKDLSPGKDFLLDLSAHSSDLKTKCTRREKFEITAQKSTELKVVLVCRGPTPGPSHTFRKVPALRTATGQVAAPPPVAPACTTCEKEYIAAGECEPDSGCEPLTGTDRELCENLLSCLRATNCWINDPLDCLCGTAKDVDCTTEKANGDCRAEIQAATKTTDPIQNGTLFFDPAVPAGRANRLISCDKEKCLNHCALK